MVAGRSMTPAPPPGTAAEVTAGRLRLRSGPCWLLSRSASASAGAASVARALMRDVGRYGAPDGCSAEPREDRGCRASACSDKSGDVSAFRAATEAVSQASTYLASGACPLPRNGVSTDDPARRTSQESIGAGNPRAYVGGTRGDSINYSGLYRPCSPAAAAKVASNMTDAFSEPPDGRVAASTRGGSGFALHGLSQTHGSAPNSA